MDHRFVLAVLVLLLGLTQVSLQAENVTEASLSLEDEDEAEDVSTRIIEANEGMSDLLLEGDVALPKNRNAMKCLRRQCKWTKSASGLVEVPYKIATSFGGNDVNKIRTAMRGFETQTCVRFVQYAGQKNYLNIKSVRGCWSSMGMTRGGQTVSLAPGCIYNGVIQHEFLHALGFYHEHTRSDRDQYVRINFGKIPFDKASNFVKKDTNNLNTPYDYSSVMHYGKTAFSRGRGDTITPIPDSSVAIGQRRGMARVDIERINKLYQCSGSNEIVKKCEK